MAEWYHSGFCVAILSLMSLEKPHKVSVSEKIDLFDNDEAWKVADDFDELKFDKTITDEWLSTYMSHPQHFFSDEVQTALKDVTGPKRLVLLARASLHITVTPSLVQKHFHNFPQDRAAAAALIIKHQGIGGDGFTHTFFGLIWGLVQDVVHSESLRGYRRSGGQYNEIFSRRELAPRFLLSNHQDGGLHLGRRFGNAAEEYMRAAKKAHELSMSGDEPLDVSRVFSNSAYKESSPEKKAEFLRVCLDDMQFALVFEETFNSAFTQEHVEDWNRRRKEQYRTSKFAGSYDPGHSMLFGTWQSQVAFDLDDISFEHQMKNTASHGGFIEEYAHHKLLLAVLQEFTNVSAESDKNTDLLVEFWIKNRNPIFANAVVRALKSQNPHRAGPALLAGFRADWHNRSAIAYVLRRVDGKTFLNNIVEIGKLLSDEPGVERFFIESCARLKRQGDLNPVEIEGSEFAMVSGGSFKGEMRRVAARMLRMQEEQYGPRGADYKSKYPELFVALDESLRERIESSDKKSRFYLYMHQGELVGFFRFDDEYNENGTLTHRHMASVMGDPKYKGGKLIETLVEQTLEKERDVPINAECDPTKPITQKYLSMGFVKKGEREELGLPIWSIELPAKQPVSKEENSTER